jgi:polar amino acid transport system substrate-binding protein
VGAVVAAGLLLAACGSSADAEPDAKPSAYAPAPVADSGRLVACVDPTVPPMEFFEKDDAQNPVGFDIDMIAATATAWGVEPQIKVSEFSGLLPALSGGTCDVVWSAIFILPERIEGEFNAVPYLNSGPVILVAGGNPEGISAPEDLSGMTVAVQSGTNFPGMLQDLNKELEASGAAPVKIQEYPGANEAAQQVIIGRAQAFLALDADGSGRVQDPVNDWEIAYTYPKELQYGVFYRKSDEELGKALEEQISEMVADGSMKAALEKWKLPTDGLIDS